MRKCWQPRICAETLTITYVSGGNHDITRYPEIHELALKYDNLKHYFIIKFGQKPGELKKFVNNILGNNDDITRFEYIKKTNKTYGQVLIGIELTHQNDLRRIIDNLKLYGFQYKYVNDKSFQK